MPPLTVPVRSALLPCVTPGVLDESDTRRGGFIVIADGFEVKTVGRDARSVTCSSNVLVPVARPEVPKLQSALVGAEQYAESTKALPFCSH